MSSDSEKIEAQWREDKIGELLVGYIKPFPKDCYLLLSRPEEMGDYGANQPVYCLLKEKRCCCYAQIFHKDCSYFTKREYAEKLALLIRVFNRSKTLMSYIKLDVFVEADPKTKLNLVEQTLVEVIDFEFQYLSKKKKDDIKRLPPNLEEIDEEGYVEIDEDPDSREEPKKKKKIHVGWVKANSGVW